MNKQDLQLLFEYNRWANKETISAAGALAPEDFIKDLASSHRSVRDTLVHTLAAEWIWLERWKGISPRALLDPGEYPTLDSIKARWTEVESGQTALLDGLNEEDLTRSIAYINQKGERWVYPLGQMMQHVINHSSYHRGQVITMLRQLGAKAVSTDFLVFIDARGK
jgi:uncharacterized damage-inducible protein DinB